MHLIYWSVRTSSRRGGQVVNLVDRGYRYFIASWEYQFIRVYEKLVQHPDNNISNIISQGHISTIWQNLGYRDKGEEIILSPNIYM